MLGQDKIKEIVEALEEMDDDLKEYGDLVRKELGETETADAIDVARAYVKGALEDLKEFID